MLRNNANYCYVNSAVRTILWAVAADPELETLLTNIGRSLIKGLLLHKGRSVLVAGHILFSAIFTGWRSPAQQHDCAEFMAHLIARIGPGVCDGKWEARRQQIDSEGQSQVVTVDEGTCCQAMSLPLPDGDMRQAQFLLHNWHTQAHPHALQKVPKLLFLSFSRYGGRPGLDQKNSCRIAWRRQVYMPVFSGGHDLSSGVVEFEVIAAIMHHGVVVTAGHYTAQLVEAEGDTLCDDNAAPTYQVRNSDAEMHQSSDVYMLVCRRSRGAPPEGAETCPDESTLLLTRAGDGVRMTVRSGMEPGRTEQTKAGSSFCHFAFRLHLLVLGSTTLMPIFLQWPGFSSAVRRRERAHAST